MRTYSDRIMVERGETWTYDILLQNRDGSPFVISNQLSNPYLCATVASSKYSQNGRYVANFWCPVMGNYKTFYSSRVIMLVDEDNDDGVMPLPTVSSDVVADVARLKQAGKVTGYGDYAVYGYDNGNEIEYRVYNDTTGAYEDEEYKFKYTIQFTNPITTLWTEQSYVFTVKLLSGEANPDYAADNRLRPLSSVDMMTSLVQPMTLVVSASVDGSLNGASRQYNY